MEVLSGVGVGDEHVVDVVFILVEFNLRSMFAGTVFLSFMFEACFRATRGFAWFTLHTRCASVECVSLKWAWDAIHVMMYTFHTFITWVKTPLVPQLILSNVTQPVYDRMDVAIGVGWGHCVVP